MKHITLILILSAIAASCRHNPANTDQIPMISVGIMTADSVNIIERDSLGTPLKTYSFTPTQIDSSLTVKPHSRSSVLEVADVTIGVGFHWQQQEPQQFEGSLRLVKDNDRLLVINDIDIERYLESVISSEMSANASQALLETHAIISRSWLLSQLARPHSRETRNETPDEITVWYDRDDHSRFDVCADDHCQRYQGVTRRTTPAVARAVQATRGQVLTYDGNICDARFSKCCGGMTELFENCWEPEHHDYLTARYDAPDGLAASDLTDSVIASQWIKTRPDAFCANPPQEVLASVLNSYDRATTDYYRWTVTCRADSLGRLVAAKTGRDLGYIKNLRPLARGTSGRIYRLSIEGSDDTLTVGKELEIRRALSPSHLYSSAFTVTIDGEGPEAVIRLNGAGWGHGVGLCQIGAAVMGVQGYTPAEILGHYFPSSTISKLY